MENAEVIESNSEAQTSESHRRVPGKYIVIGLVIFTIIFFGVALALSIGLTPAAERFHNPTPTARS